MTMAGLLLLLLLLLLLEEEEGVAVVDVVECPVVEGKKLPLPPPLPLPAPPVVVSVVAAFRLVMVMTSQVLPANVEHNS